jgi:hypothetical protein
MALGDLAQVAAHVLSGKGKNGFDDKHRGQLIVLTGLLESNVAPNRRCLLIRTQGRG